jgi:integrase/recombinase XerD
MLHLRRRHLKTCTHRDSSYLKCRCPLWVVGSLDGKFIRKSLDTRSVEKAEMLRRKIEQGDAALEAVRVADACDRWIADCIARQLKPQSIRKYREVKRELVEIFGTIAVRAVSVDDVRKIREGWKYSGTTTAKRFELIRAFFTFCVASGWIEKNPAKAIKPGSVRATPTLPYSVTEWERILWALDTYGEIHSQSPERVRRQLKALVLLMRYSGLRISDAVSLKRDAIDSSGRLFLYQAKTGHPVQIPLPKEVLTSLDACDEGDSFYFWNGVSTLKSRLTEWQERLKKVFVIAGIPEGHGHRLRDTFAVELLQRGVAIQTVSILLGHHSIATTEKHYSPWVKSRQDALESAVKLTWES